MTEMGEPLGLDQPATYQIQVQGELDGDWVDWFDHMLIRVDSGITTLTGELADQPALHGLLVKIRDLGLPLLSVNRTLSGHDAGECAFRQGNLVSGLRPKRER